MIVNNYYSSENRWMEKAPLAERDLRIKKFIFALICLMNLAGITGLLVYITMNYNIPSIEGAYSLTPFIGGVIAALLLLKLPTFGINHLTYRNLTNLPLLLSEVIAVIFFGPVLLAKNAMDWNNYADPYEAARIKQDFEKESFEGVLKKYGSRIENLHKYGYLTEKEAADFKAIYEKYKDDVKKYDYLVAKNPEIKTTRNFPIDLATNLSSGAREWAAFKWPLVLPAPKPIMPEISCWENLSCLMPSETEDDGAPRLQKRNQARR